MIRCNGFRWLTFVALTLIIIPVRGHQENTVAATPQNSKSNMRKIYEEDQKDRSDSDGDLRRRVQVRQLIDEGKVRTAEDYYYAAFIFQHGQKPTDYLYAHVLAVTAVNKGLHNASWLSAATLDRYLQSINQQQIFGTQFGHSNAEPTDQEPYDKAMVSDGVRALWCVAPQSTQEKILADIRTGKEFGSTRICTLPDARLDK
jgi:hypothetical protein